MIVVRVFSTLRKLDSLCGVMKRNFIAVENGYDDLNEVALQCPTGFDALTWAELPRSIQLEFIKSDECSNHITSEKTMVLSSNQIAASDADETGAIFKFKMDAMPTELMVGRGNNSFLRFNNIDLSGVDEIVCTALAQLPRTIGGVIEVHIDSPTGPLIGKSNDIIPTPAPAKGSTTPPAIQMPRVKLTPTTGKHAVYFVYRNEKTPDQALFVLLNLEFISRKTK